MSRLRLVLLLSGLLALTACRDRTEAATPDPAQDAASRNAAALRALIAAPTEAGEASSGIVSDYHSGPEGLDVQSVTLLRAEADLTGTYHVTLGNIGVAAEQIVNGELEELSRNDAGTKRRCVTSGPFEGDTLVTVPTSTSENATLISREYIELRGLSEPTC